MPAAGTVRVQSANLAQLFDRLAAWLFGGARAPKTPVELNLAAAEEALEIARGLGDNTPEYNAEVLSRARELLMLLPSQLR